MTFHSGLEVNLPKLHESTTLKILAAVALIVIFVPGMSRAAELNLATLTCAKYENEVLPAAATNPTADSLNTCGLKRTVSFPSAISLPEKRSWSNQAHAPSMGWKFWP